MCSLGSATNKFFIPCQLMLTEWDKQIYMFKCSSFKTLNLLSNCQWLKNEKVFRIYSNIINFLLTSNLRQPSIHKKML